MTPALWAASAAVLFLLVSHLGGWTSLAASRGAGPGGVVGARPGRLWTTSQASAHHPDDRSSTSGDAPGRRALSEETPAPPDPDPSVDDLVERARSGDQAAFATLYDRYYGNVYGHLYAKTRSRVVSEDLASETFIRALRAIADYHSDTQYFGAWLGKIARNLAIDHFRSTRSRHEVLVDDLARHNTLRRDHGSGHSPLAALDLQAALRQLPDNQRRCLELRFLLDLPVNETAAYLGVTHGAAKQLQWRGLRNLERLLRADLSA